MSMITIGRDDLIKAIASVVWYDGIGEDILEWKKILPSVQTGCVHRAYSYKNSSLQTIWMICVLLFGNYGTSPRSGWIEDVFEFHNFIDEITYIYREEN